MPARPGVFARAFLFSSRAYGLADDSLALLLHPGRDRPLAFWAAPLVHGLSVLEVHQETAAPESPARKAAAGDRAVAHFQRTPRRAAARGVGRETRLPEGAAANPDSRRLHR